MMKRKYIYYLAKLYWVGIFGLVGSFFSDRMLFKVLTLFSLFVFLNIALDITLWRCSIKQIRGMSVIKKRFKDGLPSIDNYQSELSYSLPFKGQWTAVNGCFSKTYSHSWDILTQRYAYDFIILDEHAKSYAGAFDDVDSYHCYGQEIISPADGIIIEIEQRSKDSLILKNSRFIMRAKHIAGNYIVIKHGESEYSTLAHLKCGSIKVSVGDRVKKGQTLALCGNSGSSTEPHLHFQLQTGPSFYTSAGLPVRFDNIMIENHHKYETYDSRPHIAADDIPKGYVSRGFNYANKAVDNSH